MEIWFRPEDRLWVHAIYRDLIFGTVAIYIQVDRDKATLWAEAYEKQMVCHVFFIAFVLLCWQLHPT